MAKDNTIAIRDRYWQLDKTPSRRTLAGCKVTVCEHLDDTVTVSWGPHLLGRFNAEGMPIESNKNKRCGKDGTMEAGGNQTPVPAGSHRPLEISQKARDSHFPTARTITAVDLKRNSKTKAARAA